MKEINALKNLNLSILGGKPSQGKGISDLLFGSVMVKTLNLFTQVPFANKHKTGLKNSFISTPEQQEIKITINKKKENKSTSQTTHTKSETIVKDNSSKPKSKQHKSHHLPVQMDTGKSTVSKSESDKVQVKTETSRKTEEQQNPSMKSGRVVTDSPEKKSKKNIPAAVKSKSNNDLIIPAEVKKHKKAEKNVAVTPAEVHQKIPGAAFSLLVEEKKPTDSKAAEVSHNKNLVDSKSEIKTAQTTDLEKQAKFTKAKTTSSAKQNNIGIADKKSVIRSGNPVENIKVKQGNTTNELVKNEKAVINVSAKTSGSNKIPPIAGEKTAKSVNRIETPAKHETVSNKKKNLNLQPNAKISDQKNTKTIGNFVTKNTGGKPSSIQKEGKLVSDAIKNSKLVDNPKAPKEHSRIRTQASIKPEDRIINKSLSKNSQNNHSSVGLKQEKVNPGKTVADQKTAPVKQSNVKPGFIVGKAKKYSNVKINQETQNPGKSVADQKAVPVKQSNVKPGFMTGKAKKYSNAKINQVTQNPGKSVADQKAVPVKQGSVKPGFIVGKAKKYSNAKINQVTQNPGKSVADQKAVPVKQSSVKSGFIPGTTKKYSDVKISQEMVTPGKTITKQKATAAENNKFKAGLTPESSAVKTKGETKVKYTVEKKPASGRSDVEHAKQDPKVVVSSATKSNRTNIKNEIQSTDRIIRSGVPDTDKSTNYTKPKVQNQQPNKSGLVGEELMASRKATIGQPVKSKPIINTAESKSEVAAKSDQKIENKTVLGDQKSHVEKETVNQENLSHKKSGLLNDATQVQSKESKSVFATDTKPSAVKPEQNRKTEANVRTFRIANNTLDKPVTNRPAASGLKFTSPVPMEKATADSRSKTESVEQSVKPQATVTRNHKNPELQVSNQTSKEQPVEIKETVNDKIGTETSVKEKKESSLKSSKPENINESGLPEKIETEFSEKIKSELKPSTTKTGHSIPEGIHHTKNTIPVSENNQVRIPQQEASEPKSEISGEFKSELSGQSFSAREDLSEQGREELQQGNINRMQKAAETIIKNVSEPVPPKYSEMVNQVREIIMQRHERARQSIVQTQFKIDKGPLGRMEINFLREDGAEKVIITVESEIAKSELQKYLPAIQQGMQDKGLDLLKVLVDVNDSENKMENETQEKSKNKQHHEKTGKENYEEKIAHPEEQKDYGYNTMEVIA